MSSSEQALESTADQLIELLYGELRKMAHRQLRGGRVTLDTTSLVHECYERVRQSSHWELHDRAQFLGYAARAMRSVLVDSARRKLSQRGGQRATHFAYDEHIDLPAPKAEEVLRVHEALDVLDPYLRQLVELRYFGGLAYEEVATVLGRSVRTLHRDWENARRVLYAVLAES